MVSMIYFRVCNWKSRKTTRFPADCETHDGMKLLDAFIWSNEIAAIFIKLLTSEYSRVLNIWENQLINHWRNNGISVKICILILFRGFYYFLLTSVYFD